MKKLFAIFFILTFALAACAPRTLGVAMPTTCTLVELKTWAEWGKTPNASFNDIMLYTAPSYFTGTTGVSVRTTLNQAAIDLIKRLNVNSPRKYETWAHAPSGQIYIDISDGKGGYLDANIKVQWNRILTASSGTYPIRNQVCISTITNGFGSIVGIPYQASGNYDAYIYEWTVLRVFGTLSGEPYLFNMPIFQANTGFVNSKDGDGMWMPMSWVYGTIGVIQIPWLATSTETQTITPTITPTLTSTATIVPTFTPTPAPISISTFPPECHLYSTGVLCLYLNTPMPKMFRVP